MGIFNAGTGTGGARASAQRLDLLIGILGFFTFMALVQAVVLEFQGRNAVGAALLLLVLVLALGWALHRRRSLDL